MIAFSSTVIIWPGLLQFAQVLHLGSDAGEGMILLLQQS